LGCFGDDVGTNSGSAIALFVEIYYCSYNKKNN